MTKPELIVLAGPNGSGKSTLWNKLQYNIPMINPDVVVAELRATNPDLGAVEATFAAGKTCLKEQKAKLSARETFAVETTLAGFQPLELIEKAKEQGFATRLIYVFVYPLKSSSERVAVRVDHGGHDIPDDMLQRRYQKTFDNLPKAIELVDKSFVFNNSKNHNELVFGFSNNKGRFFSQNIPLEIKERLQPFVKENCFERRERLQGERFQQAVNSTKDNSKRCSR